MEKVAWRFSDLWAENSYATFGNRLWNRSALAKPFLLMKIADLSLLGENVARGSVRVRTSRCDSLKGAMERML